MDPFTGPPQQTCQRLIQLSFAKIISAKNLKGGASLYKSLMVLHVLQRAREEQKCGSPSNGSSDDDEDFEEEMRSCSVEEHINDQSMDDDEHNEDTNDDSPSLFLVPFDEQPTTPMQPIDDVTMARPSLQVGLSNNGGILGKRSIDTDDLPNANNSNSFHSGAASATAAASPIWLPQPKRSCFNSSLCSSNNGDSPSSAYHQATANFEFIESTA